MKWNFTGKLLLVIENPFVIAAERNIKNSAYSISAQLLTYY